MGRYHSCGITLTGDLECWGNNISGEASAQIGDYVDVAVDGNHTCALDMDGYIRCWGLGEYGQTDSPLGIFASIESGFHHNCALDEMGYIECWGRNQYGQTTISTDVGSTQYADLAVGNNHNCAIDMDGYIDCWGDDTYNQVTAAPTTQFATIHAGDNLPVLSMHLVSHPAGEKTTYKQHKPLPALMIHCH